MVWFSLFFLSILFLLSSTFLISSTFLLSSFIKSSKEKSWIINSFKVSSIKLISFIKVKPKPTILDIENWLISSGLYENSLRRLLFIGDTRATSIIKFLPIKSTRFWCWLFLPDKNIFPFLFKLLSLRKLLNDSFISLNKTFKSSFDKAW